MRKHLFFTVGLYFCLMVVAQSCHEAPPLAVNEELDPTLDSFAIVKPTELRASLNERRDGVILRWSHTEPEKPNYYQIRIISIDQDLNETETLISASNPMKYGLYRQGWTDTNLDSFIKKYAVRAQYKMETGSKFSEWTDTVTVNLVTEDGLNPAKSEYELKENFNYTLEEIEE